MIGRVWLWLRRLLSEDSPGLLMLSSLVAMTLGLLSAPVIARGLGPSGRGEAMAAIAAIAVLPIMLAHGVPLEMRRRAIDEPTAALRRSAQRVWLLGTLPSALLGLTVSATIFQNSSNDVRWAVAVGLTLSPLTMSWMGDTSLLIACGRYRAVALVKLCYPAVNLLLLLAGVGLWELNTSAVIWFNVCGSIATWALGGLLVGSSVFGARVPVIGLMRGGLKYWGSSFAEAASSRLDQVLVLPLIGSVATGYYSVAVTVGSLLVAVGQSLGAVFFRGSAALEGKSRHVYNVEALGASGSVAGVVTILLMIVTPWAVPFVFGEAFDDSVGTALLMLVAGWVSVLGYVGSMLLAAQGAGKRMTMSHILSLTSRVILIYMLCPRYLDVGAGFAALIASCVIVVANARGLGVLDLPRVLLPTYGKLQAGLRALVAR